MKKKTNKDISIILGKYCVLKDLELLKGNNILTFIIVGQSKSYYIIADNSTRQFRIKKNKVIIL